MELIQLLPPANGHDCLLGLTWHELGQIVAGAKLIAEEHPSIGRGLAAAFDRCLAQHAAPSTQHASPPPVLLGPGGDFTRAWSGDPAPEPVLDCVG